MKGKTIKILNILRSSNIPMTFLLLTTICVMLLPVVVNAEVVKVEITSREVVSSSPEYNRFGPYEVIKGIIYLEVNPDDPANQLIVDMKLAFLNSRGNVEFSTEFELHKPVNAARGNHRLLYFVNNRGYMADEWLFSYRTGKNWLYSQGWSYLWCGWNCDVPESERRLSINVPMVTENGKTITGKVYSEIISYADDVIYSQPLVWGESVAYPPVTMDNSHGILTKRKYRWEEPIEIARDGWSFARFENGKVVPDPGYLYIAEGFTPGWLYDLVYTAKDPKVTGLGMAAIRDVVSFFKYEKTDMHDFINPLAGIIEYAYAWGHSQSGRLLNHFVYQNFNGDEKGRMVFDGIIANCPGAGKGQFNSRFAQFTRHGSHHEDNLYPIDFFPFTTVEQLDPITGERGDTMARARKSGFLPKMFFVNSSTDYWTRAASLLHTDVEGKKDVGIDPNVRIYLVASKAHDDTRSNSIISRALLTVLDQWVSLGIEPPASQIPKISDGTLVDLKTWSKAFPDIPGVQKPSSFYQPYRLDMGPRWHAEGIADNAPPKIGPHYVCLIPQVNEDGHEIAGIHLPEVAAPLATSTGWSMRSPSFAPGTLRRNGGRVWPLPVTAEERKKNNDPRKSILERYTTKADYLFQVTKSLLNLKAQRFLLDEDVTRLLLEAAQQTYWPTAEDASRVTIKEVFARPAEVKAGDTMILSVVFEGSIDDVFAVQAVYREGTDFYFVLNNNGKDGDEKAGDNVWSCKVQIPSVVTAGQFHFDFQAYDKDLNRIYLKGTVKKGIGESASVIFAIK
jgi:hypothetical protein